MALGVDWLIVRDLATPPTLGAQQPPGEPRKQAEDSEDKARQKSQEDGKNARILVFRAVDDGFFGFVLDDHNTPVEHDLSLLKDYDPPYF